MSPAYQEGSENVREEEDVLDFKGEEQTRRAREAFVRITLHFLKGMNQEELAVCLQSSKSFLRYNLLWMHSPVERLAGGAITQGSLW